MAGTHVRNAAAADESAAPPKSFMEESADALAGVEGALTGSKRKATASGAGGPSPKKKSLKSAIKSDARARPRSNSIERLSEVAGNLLKDTSTAVAAVATLGFVPNPMAAAAAAEVRAHEHNVNVPLIRAPIVPTGFRKKAPSKSAVAPVVAAPKPPPQLHPPPPPIATTTTATAHNNNNSQQAAAAAAAAALSSENSAFLTPEEAAEAAKHAKKTQITYNPDIPMTKEQLTAWRREMRRVRNRESAAASRRKVRDRIEELEDEVAVWKMRYQEVMARLGQATGTGGSNNSNNNGGKKQQQRKNSDGGGGKSEEAVDV